MRLNGHAGIHSGRENRLSALLSEVARGGEVTITKCGVPVAKLAIFLHDLPIRLDMGTAEQAWSATAELAGQFGLTIYDAAYLELACRRRLPLASLDQDLRRAAAAVGIEVLGKS